MGVKFDPILGKLREDDTQGITNLDGGCSGENFGGVALSPIDGGSS